MINDRYKIIRKVGEGRSKVYCCEDALRNETELAIKILPETASAEEQETFRDEFHLLKKLNHPNIINVFEFGTIVSLDKEDEQFEISAGCKFFTLEFFDGPELYECLGIKNESQLIKIICRISSVLYYLHQSAFIYYDLKSENILVKNINGEPVVKFIDFGLASHTHESSGVRAKGTAEYMAPEILRNDKIDHRVDLYSFGILLYKVIYGRFPFATGNLLDIYKAHLDEQFEFPSSAHKPQIVNLVKRLLSKEVEKRYFTSIGILEELDHLNLKNYKNDWVRIPVFAGRMDSLSVISAYIDKQNNGEVFIVRGSEGAGKTTLLNELNYKYKNAILITGEENSEAYLWMMLLRKILYKEPIFRKLNPETIQKGKRLLKGHSQNLIEDLKALFIEISSAAKFIILIDDFNSLDSFDLEIFLQLIPLLQVNKIKIVIGEDTAAEGRTDRINNLQVLNLNPFTEAQVAEFISKSFAPFFPGNAIRKTIIVYSDLLPGSIEIFIKDLIVLNLLLFMEDGPVMIVGDNFDIVLKSSQDEIYQLRLYDLEIEGRELVDFLSMFEINLDIRTISRLTGKTWTQIRSLLEKLSEANVIHQSTMLNNPQFTSRGLKEYIYSKIADKKDAHLKLSELILNNDPSFNRNELARHLEEAGEYEKSYEVIQEEIIKAGQATALSYKKNLLQHLTDLPLNRTNQRNVKKDLSACLFQLGELNASISLINELLETPCSAEEELSLKMLRGKALIGLQSLEEGKKLLESVLDKVKDEEKRIEILAEIARTEYEMGNFIEAEKKADQLLKKGSSEVQAKIYTLKGLIEFFKNNDPQKTLDYFSKSGTIYRKLNNLSNFAAMENNIGNIYNFINEKDDAEVHWNKAVEINNKIGNLLYKAIILLNNGIFYLDRCDYEKAIDNYLIARSIFITLGEKNNLAITLTNLGEAYLIICEYDNALNALSSAISIYNELGNKLEKGEAVLVLGKLYYEIGAIKKLSGLVQSFGNQSLKDSVKLEFNHNYLLVLQKMLTKESPDIVNELVDLGEKSKSYSDNFSYCNIQIIIVEELIRNRKYVQAFDELMKEDFVNFSNDNPYLDSYRTFLFGKLSEAAQDSKFDPPLVYYEKAFEINKTISVTQLTRKILFSLYESYKERGNIKKMEEYKKLTIYTINFIMAHIEFSNEGDCTLKSKLLKILEQMHPVVN